MSYKKFEKTPFEIIDQQNFDKRTMYDINIRWNLVPPSGGKKYKLWVLMKKHIEYMIFLFGIMSTDELYKIIVAIDKEIVPDYFRDIVQQFYQAKQKGGFVTSITLTNSDVFDYNDHQKFKIPTEAKFNVRKLINSVPNLKPNIPIATSNQIAKYLR